MTDETADIIVVNFTPAEFRARPAYANDVFAIGVTPTRIVGNYRIDAPIPCGIRNCGLPHQHGYVVLMPDGCETNAGWDCGLDHFGAAFLALRKVYDRAERERDFRLALTERKLRLAGLQARVRELRTQRHGGDWLLQNLRLFTRHYPVQVLDALRIHAARGEVVVSESAARADVMRDVAPGTAVDVHPSRDAILGIRIFRLDTENWPLADLESKLEEFVGADTTHLSFEDVRRWATWLDTLEDQLTQFKVMLDHGKKFFTRSNLDRLPYLTDDKDVQEQLMWMVLSKDAHDTAIPKEEKPSVLRRILISLNS